MDAYREQFRDSVEYLLGSLPSDCGTSERDITTAEEQLGVRIPTALRDYYLSVGNERDLNVAHDRLLAPKDWFLDAGRLVFMVENQAVLFWGVAALASPRRRATSVSGCQPSSGAHRVAPRARTVFRIPRDHAALAGHLWRVRMAQHGGRGGRRHPAPRARPARRREDGRALPPSAVHGQLHS